MDKVLVWIHCEVKTPPFKSNARVEAGYYLRLLQSGEMLFLPHSRPMPNIGPRCHELRIVDENKIWRIMYRIDPDSILLLDVFNKTMQTTPKSVIDNCKRRLSLYEEAVGAKKLNKERIEMDTFKRERLEAAGFKIGSVAEFLNLTEEEIALVEVKLALAACLKEKRAERQLTQAQAARMLNSSQSRIAKIEAADPSVSMDLQIRALIRMGVTRQKLGESIAGPTTRRR